MQLWDIAGQDRFAKLTRAYFRKAKGAAIVCDLTRENTLEAVKQWKSELDKFTREQQDNNDGNVCTNLQQRLPVVLFANKCDLLTDPAASFIAGARMEALCRDLGIMAWFVTSAKDNVNVEEGFKLLATNILEKEEVKKIGIEKSNNSNNNTSIPRLQQRLLNKKARSPLSEINGNTTHEIIASKSDTLNNSRLSIASSDISVTSEVYNKKQSIQQQLTIEKEQKIQENESCLLDVWDLDDC